MFKDYKKYLSTSLKVYLFVLVIVFILKIVGLNYFGLEVDNPIILKINDIFIKWKIDIVWSYLVCYITNYIMISFCLNENSKKLSKFVLFTFPITLLVKYSGYYLNEIVYYVVQLLYVIVLICIYKRKVEKKLIFNYFKIYIILLIFQLISLIVRNQSFSYKDYNFIISFILNFDYLLMLIIFYKMSLEGGIICYLEEEVGLSSLKKISLKKSLTRLQKRFQDSLKKFKKNFRRNLKKFKEKDKVEKLTIIIYIILSIIWNTLSVIVILIVARINGTIVECIFILSSFWLSKRSFGKPFHLNSMLQCFIVSNLSYFILNRVTTPLGISMFIPILLGVGLSYISSKFVKKAYKPLYRGMPEEEFENTILKVVDKDSQKYKICKEFYIDKSSDLSLSFKYNYSVSGIRKIKDRINEKIKGLN